MPPSVTDAISSKDVKGIVKDILAGRRHAKILSTAEEQDTGGKATRKATVLEKRIEATLVENQGKTEAEAAQLAKTIMSGILPYINQPRVLEKTLNKILTSLTEAQPVEPEGKSAAKPKTPAKK